MSEAKEHYVKATEVYVSELFAKPGPTPRCCAPGCGDKIKATREDSSAFEITWLGGDVSYVESDCMQWFVYGHPDVGGGFGHILEILGEQQIKLLPCPYNDREILFWIQQAAEHPERYASLLENGKKEKPE